MNPTQHIDTSIQDLLQKIKSVSFFSYLRNKQAKVNTYIVMQRFQVVYQKKVRVYTEKIQVTRGIFHAIP